MPILDVSVVANPFDDARLKPLLEIPHDLLEELKPLQRLRDLRHRNAGLNLVRLSLQLGDRDFPVGRVGAKGNVSISSHGKPLLLRGRWRAYGLARCHQAKAHASVGAYRAGLARPREQL